MGLVDAQTQLGLCLLEGKEGLDEEYVRGAALLREAGNLGHAGAEAAASSTLPIDRASAWRATSAVHPIISSRLTSAADPPPAAGPARVAAAGPLPPSCFPIERASDSRHRLSVSALKLSAIARE